MNPERPNTISPGSGMEDPAPRLWGLIWWGLMTFACSLWGQGHAGKQQDVAHQEDLELVQKGRGVLLSMSPFECPYHPPLFSREETPITPQACVL